MAAIVADKQGKLTSVSGAHAVTFAAPFVSDNYWVKVRCYDSFGVVGYSITNQTKNGFTITPLVEANVDYEAIEYETLPE